MLFSVKKQDPALTLRMVSSPRSSTSLSGGNSKQEPPESISNSEVKLLSADGSVGSPHVRVGHRQALKPKAPVDFDRGFFIVSV